MMRRILFIDWTMTVMFNRFKTFKRQRRFKAKHTLCNRIQKISQQTLRVYAVKLMKFDGILEDWPNHQSLSVKSCGFLARCIDDQSC